MVLSQLIDQAASFWDHHVSSQDNSLMLRWWDHRELHNLVNANWSEATGSLNAGEFIRKVTGRERLGTGISIGCGSAEDEIILLEQGVLDRLIICDISTKQLERAVAFVESRGIDKNRLTLLNSVDLEQPFPEKLDLVYWRHSLHHMFDTGKTLEWCRDSLADDGAVYCNDSCPPNYMQWDEEVLNWLEMYRSSLPPEYLKNPYQPDQYMATRPEVPSVEYWMSVDPTECADSAAIIPSIQKLAPTAKIAFLGGCVYGWALNDIINNFRSEGDGLRLKNAMLVDKLMSKCGMNYFFTCVINRRDFI